MWSLRCKGFLPVSLKTRADSSSTPIKDTKQCRAQSAVQGKGFKTEQQTCLFTNTSTAFGIRNDTCQITVKICTSHS